ncbi:LCP family protein [Blastococcus sp. Marseille-P5729]|uniref:LCP family protein n=1 Tax=Blastococcus sp. Marseille-P5729 TaxID=2086582 RepID=UPI0018FED5FF|nr:LCP family protein [Blastococcus sp. Marseille-P5729]
MSYSEDPDRTRELPASLDPRGVPDADPYDRTRPLPPPPGPRDPYRGAAYDPRYDRQRPLPPAEPAYRPPPGERGYPPVPPPGRGAPPAAPRPRRKRRGLRIFAWLMTALLLVVVGFVVYLDFSLNRQDVLSDYEGRPAETPGTTWLLVGSDSREDLTPEQQAEYSTGDVEGKRTDTIMLLHVPDSDAPPTLVSLPRDTVAEIPGHGEQKLNAAFSYGGGALLTQTVEGLTGMRIDRYAEIGFGGFAGVVDSVGGVEMCLDEPMNDPKAGLDLPAGCQTLNGAQALAYVRTRASANADLDRIDRQRQFLSALLSKASSPGTLANPLRSVPLALKSTGTLIVDDGCHLWHLGSMGMAMGSGELVTTTVPIASTPTTDIGSVVVWDEDAAIAFFDALRADQPIPAELITGG